MKLDREIEVDLDLDLYIEGLLARLRVNAKTYSS